MRRQAGAVSVAYCAMRGIEPRWSLGKGLGCIMGLFRHSKCGPGRVRDVFTLAAFLTLGPITHFVEGTAMKRLQRIPFQALVTVLVFLVSGTPRVFAQTRMTDKDIQSVMKNLQEDAKKFRSSFDSAVKKSTIRKTSQEKDARETVELFTEQTKGMFNQFKNSRKADQALAAVLNTSDQIDKLLKTTPMGEATDKAWAKVKTELDTLSEQFPAKSQ